MTEEQVKDFPELYDLCRQSVLPERLSKDDEDVRCWPFWKFWRAREELFAAQMTVSQYISHPFTSTHLAFNFVERDVLVSSPHVAIIRDKFSFFAILQSRLHEIWVRFFGTSMKDDLRYGPSDCFESFPIPHHQPIPPALDEIGLRYFQFRKDLMVREQLGMTELYNRFHDPSDLSDGIVSLRTLHQQMDQQVLALYGWTDVLAVAEFISEIDDDDSMTVRLRWPDHIHGTLLRRLMDLNAQIASEEAAQGDEE